MRSNRSLFQIGVFSNPWMLPAIAIPAVLHVLLIVSPLHDVFHLTALSGNEWLAAVLLASSGFFLVEGMKKA